MPGLKENSLWSHYRTTQSTMLQVTLGVISSAVPDCVWRAHICKSVTIYCVRFETSGFPKNPWFYGLMPCVSTKRTRQEDRNKFSSWVPFTRTPRESGHESIRGLILLRKP